MGRDDEVVPFGEEVVTESEKQCIVGPCKCSKGVWLIILITLINLVLFADQNLLAPVLTPVAREFGFVERYPNGTVKKEFDENLDKEVEVVDAGKRDLYLGGYVTLVFWLLGGTVSLIVGYLTDTVNRRNTLAVVVILGETACLATILVTDYTGLLLTRAFTGIAIGGAVPLVYSMVGDLFTQESRGKAVAAATAAGGIGGGLGQVMAGIVAGPDGSNWRLSFVIVAVPAYFLVAALLLTVEEPKRGHKEEALADVNEDFVYDEKVSWAKVKELFNNSTAVLVFLQGIPASLPWGVMLAFFNDALVEEKDVDRAASGTVVLSFGTGAIIGGILGGWATDRLVHRKHLIPILMGCTTAVGAFPLLGLILAPPQALWVYLVVTLPSGVVIGFTGSAVRVVLVNVTKPEVRGTAFSIFNWADDLGKGGGAVLASAIITAMGNRQDGIAVSLMGWVVGSFFHFAMARTIERDYARNQEYLEQLKGKMGGGRPIAETL